MLDRRALTWNHFLLALGQCGRSGRRDTGSSRTRSRWIVFDGGIAIVRHSEWASPIAKFQAYKCGDQDAVVQFNDPNRVATVFRLGGVFVQKRF